MKKPTPKVYYKKVGRRYQPVSVDDYVTGFPIGTFVLSHVTKDGLSTIRLVDPEMAEVEAGKRKFVDAIVAHIAELLTPRVRDDVPSAVAQAYDVFHQSCGAQLARMYYASATAIAEEAYEVIRREARTQKGHDGK